MKHSKQKISKIIDELMTFFLKFNTKHINIEYKEEKEFHKIKFDLTYRSHQKDKIKRLIKCLDCEKLEEIEEYYWELTGESDTGHELIIVGMMIDDFELITEDEHLTLSVYRKK